MSSVEIASVAKGVGVQRPPSQVFVQVIKEPSDILGGKEGELASRASMERSANPSVGGNIDILV